MAGGVLADNLEQAPLSVFTQLVHSFQSHADQALIIATDEEGGNVDRLAPCLSQTLP